MNIRLGDWVTWPGYVTETNPKGVHRVSADDMANAEPDAWQQTKPLYVPDAFALAGVPVPEGVRLQLAFMNHDDVPILGYVTPPNQYTIHYWFWYLRHGDDSDPDYWDYHEAEEMYVADVDLSRTPIADAWECLPLFVREKMEALLA